MRETTPTSQSDTTVVEMTSKFNMKEVIECGKAFGMEGQELKDFVEKERTLFAEEERRRVEEERRREEAKREEERRREESEREER